jgi:hypothetical protein
MDNKPQLLTFTEYKQENYKLIQIKLNDIKGAHIDRVSIGLYNEYLIIVNAPSHIHSIAIEAQSSCPLVHMQEKSLEYIQLIEDLEQKFVYYNKTIANMQ